MRGRAPSDIGNEDGRYTGLARPSNVIEVKSESSQGSHSAPFPRAFVEFFVKAFSDPGDIVFDPFLGSGSTIAAAAHVLGRVGYGVEISPAYCDVVFLRISTLTGDEPILAETGQTMSEVAAAHGVDLDQQQDAKSNDSRRIRRNVNSVAGGRQVFINVVSKLVVLYEPLVPRFVCIPVRVVNKH